MEHPALSSTTRLALGLAGVVGVLLVMELAPGLQRLLDPVNLLLAQAVETLVGRMDMAVTRTGTVLRHPDGFGYRIDYVCSGFRPLVLIAITILVVRATWAQRTIGILVALVGIEALNIGRLVHLYWLGVHWPEAYSVAHEVVWNAVAVLAVLAYLGTWLVLSGRRVGAEAGVVNAPREPGPPGEYWAGLFSFRGVSYDLRVKSPKNKQLGTDRYGPGYRLTHFQGGDTGSIPVGTPSKSIVCGHTVEARGRFGLVLLPVFICLRFLQRRFHLDHYCRIPFALAICETEGKAPWWIPTACLVSSPPSCTRMSLDTRVSPVRTKMLLTAGSANTSI